MPAPDSIRLVNTDVLDLDDYFPSELMRTLDASLKQLEKKKVME